MKNFVNLKRIISAVSVLAVVSFGLVVGAPAARADEVTLGCASVLGTPGTYVLAADVGSPGTPCTTVFGVAIAGSNVVLDLNGHTVWGNGLTSGGDPSANIGIYASTPTFGEGNNATVKNGTVTGFNVGILLEDVTGAKVMGMNVHNNLGPDTLNIYNGGIILTGGGGHIISGNTVVDNAAAGGSSSGGIRLGQASGSNSNTIEANVVRNNAGNGISVDGTSNVIRFNKAFGNTGFDLQDTNVAPPCDSNVWKGNGFGTKGQACISNSRAEVADFDGNGTTDVSVFRDGAWYIDGDPPVYFGLAGDIPVAGDYNGDGVVDIAVFRPSVGGWYINDGNPPVYFGLPGDIPVPGDYDGDNATDIAVFRPSTGAWYINTPTPITTFYGLSGDIPVPGDYNRDDITDIALFRPSNSAWYIQSGGLPQVLGVSGDLPVPGDYDGNGSTDLAVFRPSDGAWYVGQAPPVFFGLDGDIPVPGDYDATITTDFAVFRPSVGAWYINTPTPITTFFGLSGDRPVPQAPQA